jgi:hypothetical protein
LKPSRFFSKECKTFVEEVRIALCLISEYVKRSISIIRMHFLSYLKLKFDWYGGSFIFPSKEIQQYLKVEKLFALMIFLQFGHFFVDGGHKTRNFLMCYNRTHPHLFAYYSVIVFLFNKLFLLLTFEVECYRNHKVSIKGLKVRFWNPSFNLE